MVVSINTFLALTVRHALRVCIFTLAWMISANAQTLTANSCDDFETGTLINWTPSDTTRVGVNTDTANSGTNSMFLRHGTSNATSVVVNGSSLSEISIWVRRGADAFSEDPDFFENLSFQYLNSANVWITLETFNGAGAQGQIFIRTYPAIAAFQHPGLQLRFALAQGSGVDFDYWHVDDVCLVSDNPEISVTQTVIAESDPVAPPTGPFAIPGGFARYLIRAENTGTGATDAASVIIRDRLSADTALFVGDLDGSGSPFVFIDGTGANSSGLSIDFGGLSDPSDGVVFFDNANNPISPVGPFDPNVAGFEISFDGAFNSSVSGSTPTFDVQYRVRIE